MTRRITVVVGSEVAQVTLMQHLVQRQQHLAARLPPLMLAVHNPRVMHTHPSLRQAVLNSPHQAPIIMAVMLLWAQVVSVLVLPVMVCSRRAKASQSISPTPALRQRQSDPTAATLRILSTLGFNPSRKR